MITLAGHTAAVRSVAYSPDGTQLVSGSEDGSVRLWDLAGGGELRTWTKLRRSVETVNFLADGSAILAGTDQGTFLALDPAGKAKASKWQVEAHPAGVRSIVSMADSSHAVSTGWDRRLLFWDLKKQKSTALREPLPSSPSAMALSPRGDTLAIAQMYSSQILLVELDVRGPHGQLDFKAGSAYSLAFSSDGTLLAAGDTAGNVLVWELKTGKKPWVMKGHRWQRLLVAKGLRARPSRSVPRRVECR